MNYPNLFLPLLEKSTVLVLGAGASTTYGFPLGPQLKDQILSSLNGKLSPILVKHLKYENKFIEEFKEALQYTNHPTIDIFLEHKTKFREIGSYAIAYTILINELHRNLFPQRNWYGVLYDLLSFNNPVYKLKNLSVVTLNYDRSLEYFLKYNIQYNCPDKFENKAAENAKDIQIIHAHGSFGELSITPYGSSPTNPIILAAASKSIKIVSDKLESSDQFKSAQSTIKNATNILILGLGYDIQTLGKLFMGCKFDDKSIIGTAFGLDVKKEGQINKFFKDKIKLDELKSSCDVFLNSKFPKTKLTI